MAFPIALAAGAYLGSMAFNGISQYLTNSYMRNQQDEAWEREDNSVQRRVADLKAAGLSPVLAAGQGASSSGPVNVSAPQVDSGDIYRALSYEGMTKQNALTDAQRDLVETNQDNADAVGFLDRMKRDEMIKNATEGHEGKNNITRELVNNSFERDIAKMKAEKRAFEDEVYNSDMAHTYQIPVQGDALSQIVQGRLMEQAFGGSKHSRSMPFWYNVLSSIGDNGTKLAGGVVSKGIPSKVIHTKGR